MAAPSLFCEHKKLRTTCPECRPPPPPRPEPAAPRRAPREAAEPKAPDGPRALGRPVRRRSKKITADEAANADAWWVKKD